MFAFLRDRRGTNLITGLLITQMALLWLSLDSVHEISIACAGPASSDLGGLFFVLHLGFVGLFLIGVWSLSLPRLRSWYVALLVVAIAALPVQAMLVSRDVLTCSTP